MDDPPGPPPRGVGLTRPELAVLLGLAKLQVQAALCESELVESDYLDVVYHDYFPERFQREQPGALASHRLRREITALGLVNRLIDPGGASLFTSLSSELGVSTPLAAAALVQAEDVLQIPDVRARLLAQLGGSRAVACEALVELDVGVRTVAGFLVHLGACDLDGERIARWRSGVEELLGTLLDFLSPGEQQRLAARRERLEARGLPEDLALSIGALPLADRGLNILRIVESTLGRRSRPPAPTRGSARRRASTGSTTASSTPTPEPSGTGWCSWTCAMSCSICSVRSRNGSFAAHPGSPTGASMPSSPSTPR